MLRIFLTDEHAHAIAASTDLVEVCDSQGRVVTFLRPVDASLTEAILECRRRLASPDKRIPSADVQAHLRKLNEIRLREGMDRNKMLDLLRRMRAGEA